MSSPVYVAGIGVISAIGNNVAESLASFELEEAGMGQITLLETVGHHDLPGRSWSALLQHKSSSTIWHASQK